MLSLHTDNMRGLIDVVIRYIASVLGTIELFKRPQTVFTRSIAVPTIRCGATTLTPIRPIVAQMFYLRVTKCPLFRGEFANLSEGKE